MKAQNDFQYSLDLLKRINRLSVNGGRLSHRKILGRYNVWIFFQNSLFFNEIKAFRSGNYQREKNLGILREFKEAFLKFFALVVTLLSFLSAFVRRAGILVYSVDRTNSRFSGSDARLDPVYEALFEKKTRFLECFHTLLGRVFILNLFKRYRLALYQRGVDRLFTVSQFFGGAKKLGEEINWSTVDLKEFNEEEKKFVKAVVGKYIKMESLIEFRTKVFRKIFETLKIKAVLTIDDPRDYNDAVLAARLCGIPVHAFQHGHFTKYHVGWLDDGTFDGEIIHPDRLYVWSNFWKEELLRLGTYFQPEEILVGGEKEEESLFITKTKSQEITVVIPFEVDSDKEQVKKYIDEILEAPDIRVLFKLRSDRDVHEQLSLALLSNYSHPRFSVTANTQEAIERASVFAGTYSTFLYDMISTEKPVIYLESSSDFGEGLVINQLAEKISLGEVADRIREISRTPEEVLKERKRRLYGFEKKLMKNTVRELLEELA